MDQGKRKNINTNKLIEKPSITGETCFQIASGMSKEISKYILENNIEVDFISKKFMLPWFKFKELTKMMLLKNINPFIVYKGMNQLDRYPDRFANFHETVNQFDRAAFYFTEDTKCNEKCSPGCNSTFKRFKCYRGVLAKIEPNNLIGNGAFGTVYKGKWHGEDVAMKCTILTDSKWRNDVANIQIKFEQQASEYLLQSSTSGDGVLLPYAMFRQQNQELVKDQWKEINYHVTIYPKYDCNLYELHEQKYDVFSDDIMENMLHQCLSRK